MTSADVLHSSDTVSPRDTTTWLYSNGVSVHTITSSHSGHNNYHVVA